MKKSMIYLFWTLVCLNTTVSFSQAANTDMEDTLADISAIFAESNIDSESNTDSDSTELLNLIFKNSESSLKEPITRGSAPKPAKPVDLSNHVFTSWELAHRTVMMQGFVWTWSVANFISPAMYIGTPIETNSNDLGYSEELGPTNYHECVRYETTNSFWTEGIMLEETVEDELRNIAKHCAQEFYGVYFNGKDYTTREEMLMMLFTMFDEWVILPGTFEGSKFIFDWVETETPFGNVWSREWYSPYITLAYEYIMTNDEDTWTVWTEVTNSDIWNMFGAYIDIADTDYDNTVDTTYGTYMIELGEESLAIQKK